MQLFCLRKASLGRFLAPFLQLLSLANQPVRIHRFLVVLPNQPGHSSHPVATTSTLRLDRSRCTLNVAIAEPADGAMSQKLVVQTHVAVTPAGVDVLALVEVPAAVANGRDLCRYLVHVLKTMPSL